MNGATFPMVGVAVVYSEHPDDEDAAPFVSVSVTGSGTDIDLRVPEAKRLIDLLQEAIDTTTA